MAEKNNFTTPEFRLSFPSLFEKTGFQDQDKKYRATMLFPKKDKAAIKLLKEKAEEAIAANRLNWNAKVQAEVKKNIMGKTIRDGDSKEYDGYAGMIFVSASNTYKPAVVDRERNEILDKEDVYAGCYCRASIHAFVYDAAGNRGVSFGLGNVQKLRDGEPFGNRSTVEDDFDDLEDEFTEDGNTEDDDLFG